MSDKKAPPVLTSLSLTANSFIHYRKQFVFITLAIILATTILAGAIFLGDSVRNTLIFLGTEKLGRIEMVISQPTGANLISDSITVDNDTGFTLIPLLKIPNRSITSPEGIEIPRFQLFGADSAFFSLFDTELTISEKSIIINEYLADLLNVSTGDSVIIRSSGFSSIHAGHIFYPGSPELFSDTYTIQEILPNRRAGRFSLSITQSVEAVAYVNRKEWQREHGIAGKTNLYLAANPSHSGKRDESLTRENLAALFSQKLSLADSGLSIKQMKPKNFYLESSHIFLSTDTLTTISELFPGAAPVFSYFLNNVSTGDDESPFVFVTALPKELFRTFGLESPRDNQSIISDYLKTDLSVSPGDELDFSYFHINEDGTLTEKQSTTTVSQSIAVDAMTSLVDFIPAFPGMAGKASCREWDPSIPVDLKEVRPADETYWNEWGFTPKVIMTLNQAQTLWSSPSSAATGMVFSSDKSQSEISMQIAEKTGVSLSGLQFIDLKDRISRSGNNSLSFSGLFLGLSFVLMLSAILLLVFTIRLFYEQRQGDFRISLATGFSPARIQQSIMTELILCSIPGIILGTAAGTAYTLVLISLLKTIWFNAARMDIILLSLQFKSMVISIIASFSIVFLSSLYASRQIIKNFILKENSIKRRKPSRQKVTFLFLWLSVSSILILTALYVFKIITSRVIFFFGAGFLSLVVCALLAMHYLNHRTTFSSRSFALSRRDFFINSLRKNSSQNFAVILFMMISIFLVVTVGANRQASLPNSGSTRSGTGGFDLYIQLQQAVNPQIRNWETEWNLKDSHILPIRVIDGDESSCLNLNQISTPKLFGIDTRLIVSDNRFSLAGNRDSGTNPWLQLENPEGDKKIPVMVDQTVLEWSLGKQIGDTLTITAENGIQYQLVIIASIQNSIFQGGLILSETNLKTLFPTNSGYHMFFIDLPPETRVSQSLLASLQRQLRSFGAVVKTTTAVLNEYYSVENSYLAIFFQLGLISLVISILGMTILLVRKIQDSSIEIQYLLTLGFKRHTLLVKIFLENHVLITYAMVSGTISSLLALWPLFQQNVTMLFTTVAVLLLVFQLLTGIFTLLILTHVKKILSRVIRDLDTGDIKAVPFH